MLFDMGKKGYEMETSSRTVKPQTSVLLSLKSGVRVQCHGRSTLAPQVQGIQSGV